MDILREYSEKYGIPEVIDTFNEYVRTDKYHIVFPNGWIASIVPNLDHKELDAKYSVAMCDYDGYFDWVILNQFGATKGCFYCNDDLEVLIACETIRRLRPRS